MSTNTEFSTLELFREGLKMWNRFAENPYASKFTYFYKWPTSPLLNAKNNCAGCEEVAQDCSKCRLLTEEEKRNASGPVSNYLNFCCNGEYQEWYSSSSSWLDKKIAAEEIAERHRKAIETLEKKT